MTGYAASGGRGGRTTWGRAGTWSGVGGLALVLLVLGSSVAAAGSATVLTPKYPGTATPSNDLQRSGCGIAHAQRAWGWLKATGTVVAASSGHLHPCRPQGSGASGNATGAVALAIPFKAPSGSPSVRANLTWNGTLALNASDGFVKGSPACNARGSWYHDQYTEWQWNYGRRSFNGSNSSFGFGNYYYSTIDASSGGNSTQSGGTNSGPPSPFHENKTTYYYHSNAYGASNYCVSSASADLAVYAALVDPSSGSFSAPSGSSMPSYGTLVTAGLEIVNYTDWSCQNYSEWDGPTGYSVTTNVTCTSYNGTLTSYVYHGTSNSSSGSYGHANQLAWSATVAGTGSLWWNRSLKAGQSYELELYVYGDLSVGISWAHGAADWALSFYGPGRGIQLTSISIY